MPVLVRASLIFGIILLAGCPGGGGSVNLPPTAIKYGEPITIEYELSVWGAGSGRVSKRYTAIRCHYKAEKATAFTTLDGTIDRETADRIFVSFKLPKFAASDGAYVEYYLDEMFDGHYNRRPVERVPLR